MLGLRTKDKERVPVRDWNGGERTLFATEKASRDCLAHGEMKKRRDVAGKR